MIEQQWKPKVTDMLNRSKLVEESSRLMDFIKQVDSSTIINIDLKKVHWINASGVQEMFGANLELIKTFNSKYIIFDLELNDFELPLNLHYSLGKDFVVLARINGKFGCLLGQFLGKDLLGILQTLRYVFSVSSCIPSEVAKIFEISIMQASTYLSKLESLRLLSRERIGLSNGSRGYTFKYYPLFTCESFTIGVDELYKIVHGGAL
jgi:hypothetical protein